MMVHLIPPQPSDEVRVKNIHLQEVVKKWIKGSVQETIFGFSILQCSEKAVEKDIPGKVASWNSEVNLEEPCPGVSQKNVQYAWRLCRRWWGNIM
jgi:hypothetical protein